MTSNNLKAIACTISRGGFSEERVFSINLHGVTHSGIASRRHMWGENWLQIEEGEPPIGVTVKGFVAAKIIEINEQKQAMMVSIPDGEVITIPIGALVDRQVKAGINVPVGS